MSQPDPHGQDIEFGLAARSDLPVLLDLLIDDDVARLRGDYTADVTGSVHAAFDEIAADPHNELWVARRHGEVVAMFQLTFIPGLSRGGLRRAQIEAVRVRADLRGQGIGSALMAHATERAEAAGCGMMQLSSDRRRLDAHRFYEQLGYEPSHVGMKRTL